MHGYALGVQAKVCADLGVEDVRKAGHDAADGLELLALGVPGRQQEGGEPAGFPALAVPGADGHKVQRIPQPLTVIPTPAAIVRKRARVHP